MKILPTIILLSPIFFAGCITKIRPLFCGEDGIDCNRPDELGDKNFCDIDKLYSATDENECVARPDPDACNRVEPCTDDAKPHCDNVAVGAKGTCVECVEDTHCPGAICDDSGACAGFTCTPGTEGDATCLAADSNTPICVAADTCGECNGTDDATQCPDETKSVCNTVNYTCRGCTDHGECGSGVCNIGENTCLDEGVIVLVAPGGTDDAGCGSPQDECETIAFALSDRVDVTRNVVAVASGSYSDPLDIAAGTVTILGIGATKPIVDTPLSGTTLAALTVSGTANVTIDELIVAPASGPVGTDAIMCTGANASITISRSEVNNAPDLGIVADNCSLTLTQSTVFGNRGGGVDVNNSDFTIVNNFIAYNGGSATIHAGVDFRGSGSPQDFNFNTVVGNHVSAGTSGLSCLTVAPVQATGNIIYSDLPGASLSLANNCTHTYSDIKGALVEPGVGNINENPLLVNDSAISGDYHLGGNSPCTDTADPAATLAVDIDGDMRPGNGRSDMGADEAN